MFFVHVGLRQSAKDITLFFSIFSTTASNAVALKRMFQDISDKTCVRFVQKRSSDANYALIKSGTKLVN